MIFPGVAVVIPALNEEASLPLVLADLPTVAAVIVVDNGSTDETAQLAKNGGAIVIRETQRGYGKACLSGIAEVERLIDQQGLPIEVIVFADADYSDHVDAIGELIEPILLGECDFVLGSRLKGEREQGAMPPQSLYGNRLACWLMRLTQGKHPYSDLGPLRAIRMSSLRGLEMIDTNFGWTIEMQIKALRQGLSIRELPVAYRRRIGTSKISGTVIGTVRAGTKIIYSIWKYRK